MGISKRRFIQTLGVTAAMTAIGQSAAATPRRRYDLLVIGAGTAGIPAAIFAAARGASVLVLDAAATIGGTLCAERIVLSRGLPGSFSADRPTGRQADSG